MGKFPHWIYKQSAALPYRLHKGDPEVLLVTSRKGTRWVLPKGIVEPGLTSKESAVKEAREEAGIEGKIAEKSIGTYDYRKWGGTCTVEVFPMKVMSALEEWPEAAVRRREWLTVEAAAKRVDEAPLKKLIRRLPKAIKDSVKSDKPRGAASPQRRLICLLRHAKSSWDDPTLEDIDRPLAPRGRRATEVMRDYIRLADINPDLVLCSPSARTRETLQAVKAGFGGDIRERYEEMLYHGDAPALLERLRSLSDASKSIMLVGHNPDLQDLAISLAGSGDTEAIARMRAKFPTGALALLVLDEDHWEGLTPGACELHSFVVPRELA